MHRLCRRSPRRFPPARGITPEGMPTFRRASPRTDKTKLLRSCLQLAACGQLDAVARSNLDRRTRLRVAAGTGSTVGALDGEPSRDRDLGALGQRVGEGVEQRVDNRVNGGLVLTGLSSDRCDQLGTVQ